MAFDHKIYFDNVRTSLFGGELTQDQVDGQEAILTTWEKYLYGADIRHLAYMLATTKHETASEMMPIEEYGKGEGMEYGKPDPETGQTYYGRGFVQLTWRDNYARSDREIADTFDIVISKQNASEWHAELQLNPTRAMLTMYLGMKEGWFRSDSTGKQTLDRYFNETVEDPYTAREIINGDKATVPSWSDGISIGTIIQGYYSKFLTALRNAGSGTEPSPDPTPDPQDKTVEVAIIAEEGVQVVVKINGREL